MKNITTPGGKVLPVLDIKGKDYLQVCWRLVWFREEHPDWGIETEFVHLGPAFAMAKATIKDATGKIIATGHKNQSKEDFFDFHEGAETGAIGRALAHVGYGTQYEEAYDDGVKVVDAPVQRPPGPSPQSLDNKPIHCGKKMMVSKFNDLAWYCYTCKATIPRDPAPIVDDLPDFGVPHE